MVKPEIILHYWRGGEIPQWRQECTRRLMEIYPDAQFISDVAYGDFTADQNYYGFGAPQTTMSDVWRFKMCATNKRCLWVDNDIELLKELPLSELPAMALEYRVAHCSVVWSGDNPDMFFGPCVQSAFKQAVKTGRAELIAPAGNFVHYAGGSDGSRNTRGY